MDNPIKQYIQDLIIDTVNAVTYLDTTINIALSYKKIITNQKWDTSNLLYYILLNIIKQIRRKVIKKNNNKSI